MGPRVREDDSVRELIRTPSCHSRACGDPFIHTCQKPRLEITLTAADNNESETSSNNEALKPSYSARYPMGPRVREDDKNKKRKSRAKFSGKEQKTQHTAATPPTVIPAQTGIHSSARARSRVWKCTCRDRQRRKRSQQQHG